MDELEQDGHNYTVEDLRVGSIGERIRDPALLFFSKDLAAFIYSPATVEILAEHIKDTPRVSLAFEEGDQLSQEWTRGQVNFRGSVKSDDCHSVQF